MYTNLKTKMNIEKLIAVEVLHCPQSYACLLFGGTNMGPGNKVIYSGDTRPCQNFINYARNSSLLIHEATLQHGMEQDALHKRHTSTSEAITLISEAQPWRSILTHFSCRYQKVAEILPDHSSKKVMVAFDHLRLYLKDFEWAHKYLSIYEQLLSNEKEGPEKDTEEKKVESK